MLPNQDVFNGKHEIMLFPADSDIATAMPLGEVVADSLSIIDEGDEEDATPIYRTGYYSVDLANVEFNSEVIMGWSSIDKQTLHDFIVRPVQIKFSYVPLRKPSNLKFPHKKRKIRLLKKWCKRYGKKHPTELFIRDAKIQTTLDPKTFAINFRIDAEGKNIWK